MRRSRLRRVRAAASRWERVEFPRPVWRGDCRDQRLPSAGAMCKRSDTAALEVRRARAGGCAKSGPRRAAPGGVPRRCVVGLPRVVVGCEGAYDSSARVAGAVSWSRPAFSRCGSCGKTRRPAQSPIANSRRGLLCAHRAKLLAGTFAGVQIKANLSWKACLQHRCHFVGLTLRVKLCGRGPGAEADAARRLPHVSRRAAGGVPPPALGS